MDWLRSCAKSIPHHIALITEEETYTFESLDRRVDSLCYWLTHTFGVTQGTSVGIHLPSSAEYVGIIHALNRLSAVAVPLNTRLSASELTYQKQFCDIVVDESTQGLKAVFMGGLNDYAKLFKHQLDLNQPYLRLFTSGTTGQPKAAELTRSAVFYNAIASAFRIGHQSNDRWLCTLPLYHIGGLSILIRSVISGTGVVLLRGFDTASVNHALDVHQVTLASFVPTMLYRLTEARTTPPSKLRLVLLGGAAATSDLVSKAKAAGFPIATTYGLTEAASQVCTQLPESTHHKPASVGKPLPFVNVRVVNSQGDDCSTSEIGEIIINGPTLMLQYVNNPTATAQTLRDGWLYTGDLGYLDADGDLHLVQRRSDLIVSGGENIYPAEVEAALRLHPVVQDAAVIGLPHPEWGQQPAAAVILRPNITAPPPVNEIIQFLRQHLAGYKIPRIIRFVDALPLTASGKIERRQVMFLFNDYTK